MPDLLDPITPGELLSEEFLKPLGLSQYRLAKEIGVPAQRIGQIVLGRLPIPTCASAASSVSPMATGFAPRRPTIWKSPGASSSPNSSESVPSTKRPACKNLANLEI